MKEAIIHPKALAVIRAFSKDARLAVGKGVRELQKGYILQMPLSRSMPSIALGVHEIRVRDRNGIYRVFYYLKSKRGILLFHAFVKKTQKTEQNEIEIGRQRLKEMLNESK